MTISTARLHPRARKSTPPTPRDRSVHWDNHSAADAAPLAQSYRREDDPAGRRRRARRESLRRPRPDPGTARARADRPVVADRGAAANAAQQPRRGGRRAPEELIVYGGSGRAARSHDALRAIVRALLRLGDDETLLVQSGKAVGVFRTHEEAPRVLIANSLLVPRWANWDEFRRLEALDLTMFGQMTAGSWIYIGTQGILQGTYQTFAAAGERHFGSSDLAGRTILTAGLGRYGRRPASRGDDDGCRDSLHRGRRVAHSAAA